jgi:hypothetical protein
MLEVINSVTSARARGKAARAIDPVRACLQNALCAGDDRRDGLPLLLAARWSRNGFSLAGMGRLFLVHLNRRFPVMMGLRC